MAKVGGKTTKFYTETRGLKASGGQVVKAGSLLTREGHRWKSGVNVVGDIHLTAKCDGEVYFTRKKNTYNKVVTYINVRAN
jgi:ribosomal protein L27